MVNKNNLPIKSKRSNSHFDFISSSYLFVKSKRSQAEVIVTVLLILIALAAVAVVSVFVIGLVKENLTGTDCFKTVGQFEIKSAEEGVTCYNSNAKTVSVTLERGSERGFNLTSLSFSVGNKQSSKVFEVAFDLPAASEKKTYSLDVSSANLTTINFIKFVPLIGEKKQCSEGSAEKEISTCV